MLIPPSVLMIVWGILTEQSIGQLFAAGVLPGLLLTSLFVVYVFAMALLKPNLVGVGTTPQETAKAVGADVVAGGDVDDVSTSQFLISLFGIIAVVVAVLGGIWFGIRDAPIAGPADHRHGGWQCAVLVRDRCQHRLGGGVFAHRVPGNETVRL